MFQAYKFHHLDSGPATTYTISRDEALHFYKEMLIVRRMETAAGNLYKEKAIRGFCHLYSGQVLQRFRISAHTPVVGQNDKNSAEV